MTVRQSGQQTFNAPKADVEEHVRDVLRDHPAYRNVREPTEGTVFTLNIKPNILLLGTDMKVVLDESGSQTIVTATTTSQLLIMGDAFGSYYRYVRDFLTALENSLDRAQGGSVVSSEPVYKMAVDWVAAVIMLLLVAWLIWFGIIMRLSATTIIVLVAGIILALALIRMVRGGRLGI